MTRAEAEAECRRLARESPERGTHRWIPRRLGGGWAVVKVDLPPAQQPSGTESRGDEGPPTAEDPRPSSWRDVPPWAAGG